MAKQANLHTGPMDRERGPEVLTKLYNKFGTNTEGEGNYRDLAGEFGLPDSSFMAILADLNRTGILERRYGIARRPDGSRGGKVSYWRLPYPHDEAQRRIARYWAETPAGKKGPAPSQPSPAEVVADTETTVAKRPPFRYGSQDPAQVAIRRNGDEPVEAIAGPDAPNPFEVLRPERKDEPAALIEAARQYASRQDVVKRAFTELEKQGVTIDWNKIGDAVRLESDERLDTIASILPYITNLERQVQRATENNAELRERARGYDTLKTENSRLREQNQRLIANRVGERAQATSRA